jgi:hypothetical protein
MAQRKGQYGSDLDHDQELAAAQMGLDRVRQGNGLDPGHWGRLSDAQNRLYEINRRKSDFNQGYWAQANKLQAYNQGQANQQAALENSQGVQAGLGNSDVDKMILENLRKTSGPDYENALFTQGADMAAAAETARGSQLQEQMGRRGMSMNDPAAQAAMGQNFSQRQQATQKAALDAKLGAAGMTQNATSQAIGYQGGLNGQRLQAADATNRQLGKPVVGRPTSTVNGAAGSAGADAANAATQATKPGYQLGQLNSGSAYDEYVASTRKPRKPWEF